MGYKRDKNEKKFATKELSKALARLSNPNEFTKFLAYAVEEINADPTKLAARINHVLKGTRLPTLGIGLLLKKFEKLP